MTGTKSVEITPEEWNNRKLSKFGYFSSLIDIVQICLAFAGIGAISQYCIPVSASTGQVMFWYILTTLFFIMGLKKVFKVMDPANNYQTIIIRK